MKKPVTTPEEQVGAAGMGGGWRGRKVQAFSGTDSAPPGCLAKPKSIIGNVSEIIQNQMQTRKWDDC